MTIDPTRWDDYILAGLMLVISVPRAVLALTSGHPFGAEDTLSMAFVVVSLVLLLRATRRG